MLSTRETPETTASPAEVTIIVSAIPTVMSSSCSMTKGTIKRTKACREKRGGLASAEGIMENTSLYR